MSSFVTLTTSLIVTACTCVDIAPAQASIPVSSDFGLEAIASAQRSTPKPTAIFAIMLFGSVVLLSQQESDEENC